MENLFNFAVPIHIEFVSGLSLMSARFLTYPHPFFFLVCLTFEGKDKEILNNTQIIFQKK